MTRSERIAFVAAFMLALAVGCAACAHQTDPRVAELAALERSKVTADAAFAAWYQMRHKDTLDRVAARGGTLQDYLRAMAVVNARQTRFVALVHATNAAMKTAAKQLREKVEGDVALPVRDLVEQLLAVLRETGVGVVGEVPE